MTKKKNLPQDNVIKISLQNTSLNELGHLFPIVIQDYSEEWVDLYQSERSLILSLFEYSEIIRIDHIGSTAIAGLKAKPTIDILLQVSEHIDLTKIKSDFKCIGYLLNEHPDNPAPHLTFVKGYSTDATKEQTYHVHVRYSGDWDEIRFRDYLINNKLTISQKSM